MIALSDLLDPRAATAPAWAMRWLVLALLLLSVPAVAPGVSPAGAQVPPTDRQAALDRMLDALKAAPSEADAAPLEARITEMLMQQGSPAVTLLMSRGLRELKSDAPGDAVEDLGAAITLDPNFAEAWHQRAIARFATGDALGAIADLQQTLQLQPRDFGAFRTLSSIAESREDWKGAYAAWQKLLELDPKTPGGQERLKDLRRHALGEEA